MLLTPKQTRKAVEHVLHVHKLEEAKRRQLAECTETEELREMMLECGLPQEDVDRAMKELPKALAEEGLRKQKSIILALVALLILGVVGVTAQALNGRKVPPAPAPAPREEAAPAKAPRTSVYLVVEAEMPENVRRSIPQDVFSGLLSQAGFSVVEDSLANGKNARFTVVGKGYCQLVGTKVFGTNMSSMRSSVVLRVLDNRQDGELIGSAKADAGSMHIDAASGCNLAIEEAAKKALPELLAFLGAKQR